MNRHRTTATLLGLAALAFAAPMALGGDIYTWTDENGVVHFGDRPSGVASERVIHIASERSSPARPPAPSPAASAPKQAAETAAAAEQTEEERRAAEEERAEQCRMYKERLQTYLTARRLYREDENGERVYLSEEEILAARAKVQQQIVEHCEP